ncbi:MAG: cytochrome-c peroxidase [Chitinophagales bacterium]|nr:cytochrome-c peroxidase [Chitinophagales bacterium]
MHSSHSYQLRPSYFSPIVAIVMCTASIILGSGCKMDEKIVVEEIYILKIPPGFPYPSIPEDNPLTTEKIELGKQLFFDPVLSLDSTISCSSCHKPEFAFSDNISVSHGVENQPGFRNAPSLANVAYQPYLLKDGGNPALETQVQVPVEDVAEMNFNMALLVERLQKNVYYKNYFIEVFGKEPDAFGLTRALAAFQRTLLSGSAKYDRALSGEMFLTASELKGEELFFSKELNCSSCHAGFNFTDYTFQNTGLYSDYTTDVGRKRITLLPGDEGKFKVSSLRNVGVTGPYMHDGSLGTLEEVITFYMSGGSDHPNKSNLIKSFVLTDQEKKDLINFLFTLTDETFITNPEFQ